MEFDDTGVPYHTVLDDSFSPRREEKTHYPRSGEPNPKVRFGVVEAVNANIRLLINRGRGYKNLRYLLLKAKRMAVTNVEFLAVQRVKKAA